MNITEEMLREALRPRRPDPEAFRRDVERKIAEREAEREIRNDEPLRQAASLFPLGWLQSTVIGTSAGTLAKKGILKAASSTLTMPVMAIAMLGLTFVAAVRALSRITTGTRSDMDNVQAGMAAWWRAHALHAVLALLLLGALAVTQPAEAVFGVLFLSMLAAAGQVVKLSKMGAANRATVGRLTSGLLATLFFLMAFADGSTLSVFTVHLPPYWVRLVLLAGWIACHFAGTWSRSWSTRRKWSVVLVPTICLATFAGMREWLGAPLSDRDLVLYVEEFERPLDDSIHWTAVGPVGEWLASAGIAFDVTRARTVVEEALTRNEIDPDPLYVKRDLLPLNGLSLQGASRLGALSERAWEAIGESYGARSLREHRLPVHPASDVVSLQALVREGALTEAERDGVAAKILESWPDGSQFSALSGMALRVEMLDVVGRPISVEDYRARVHAALERVWFGRVEDRPYEAPFALSEELMKRWFRIFSAARLGESGHVEPTQAAIRLMRRFGAPENIDLDRVRAFLQRASSPSLLEVLLPASSKFAMRPHRYRAAVALRELMGASETRPEAVRSRRFLSLLLAERVLLAAVLLVALCLFATLCASRPESKAMPREDERA